MKRMSMRLGVGLLVGAAVVPIGAAAASPAQAAATTPAGAIGVQHEGQCGTTFNGKPEFTGTVEYTLWYGGGEPEVEVTRYRIDKHSTAGGNSANIVLYQGGTTARSGDDLRQDAEWHDLRLSASGPGSWGRIEFVFDKSIMPDPSCTIRYTF